MVTGLALSSSGEELVFCSHSLRPKFLLDPVACRHEATAAFTEAVPALAFVCRLVFVPEFSTPTSLNVRFLLRTASTFVTLWRTSANAAAKQRAEGLNCVVLKLAV